MDRVVRIDRAVTRLVLLDQLVHDGLPAGCSPAIVHPDGYLIADAYMARDGLLQYSDGVKTWIEYRPRGELLAAASTWHVGPVTDDHPPEMVTADTWGEYARGFLLDTPIVTPPDAAGISYLRSRLVIGDRGLVQSIRDGRDQLSIGFTTRVIPQPGVTDRGRKYDAVQTQLLGNHTAVVQLGRAGPTCRILTDSADAAVSVYFSEDEIMKLDFSQIRKDTVEVKGPNGQITRVPKWLADKLDEAGSPTDTVEVVGPSGEPETVSTWVAAALQELMTMKQAAQAPAPAQPQAPAPAQPQAPAPAQPQAPAPAAEAMQPPPPAPASGQEPEEDKNEMTEEQRKESIRVAARRRARLERLALSVGVPERSDDDKTVTIDADDETLAREYVRRKIPSFKVDGLKGEALEGAVAAAEAASEPARSDGKQTPAPAGNPWERKAPIEPKADVADKRVADFLRAQGY